MTQASSCQGSNAAVQTIELKRPTPHPKADNWSLDEIAALFDLPFNDLLFQAQLVHREHFDASRVQLSTLLSVKTGGCSEDCGYCSQSAHHEKETGLEREKLMTAEDVIDAAKIAKENGSSRFCMGAAWRGPKNKDLDEVKRMIAGVKALGLETCATFGMLKDGQAEELRDAGLDYYNHNLDTSPEKYGEIVTTHSYDDRLDTLGKVRKAGLSVCSGGIVGLGETRNDRVGLIAQLANLDPQPDSVPINNLVQIEGTPLEGKEAVDWTEFVRTIAVARITMPKSFVRLSAGRQQMDESMQALCFLAGANSIFYGDKLLTTGNPDVTRDRALFAKLDIQPL
ncbi:biotin synthase BioB [Chitinilyticum aquatile]|uniref:biotin synthase BioB n=1 Tax=Chitinilyticum aquatile TaxID=362520 RepID=UPI00049032E0|nr:biotin synthase BioB [Chitinilyticum aquatile]